MENLKKSTISIFWMLVIVFLIILGQFFLQAVGNLLEGSKLFLIPMVVFCLLGVILLILILKEKTRGKIKTFLILTGASAAGFFVFVVLHNVFYALNIVAKGIFILNYLTEGLHVFFFLIATLVCPIGVLVGIIGTIILFIKKKLERSRAV